MNVFCWFIIFFPQNRSTERLSNKFFWVNLKRTRWGRFLIGDSAKHLGEEEGTLSFTIKNCILLYIRIFLLLMSCDDFRKFFCPHSWLVGLSQSNAQLFIQPLTLSMQLCNPLDHINTITKVFFCLSKNITLHSQSADFLFLSRWGIFFC